MALASGTRLAEYEVLEPIGAGGMGEVYRARDTKLGRDVAIKVLPDLFAADGERLARFEREARLLASLNHPNIATLYGLEEHDGVHYLAMELVEGENLAGPLPLDEVISVFKQIAEALEAAHEKGIIHRDLKPANVKITSDGKVKVLDFGLAKAYEDKAAPSNISESPTVTREGTAVGVIMGTAAYMSPEQAKGKPLDKRTDIWSFGCCLYETMTGRQAFGGETVSEVLANVLKGEPDWDAVPDKIRKLVRRCLTKDPRYRLRDIGDAWVALQEEPDASTAGTRASRGYAPVVLAALALLVTGILIGRAMRSPVPRYEIAKRLTLKLTEPISSEFPSTALSPDGTSLVYVADVDGRRQLVVRRFDEHEGQRVPGTEDASRPFFSPDGQWIGFLTHADTTGAALRGEVKKVPVSGGLPVTLTNWAGITGRNGGGAWGDDDFIVFPSKSGAGLSRISASGGSPETLTAIEENSDDEHGDPWVLPGSRAILFSISRARGPSVVTVVSLETGEQRTLTEGDRPQYVPSGHVVYRSARTLMAVPFHAQKLTVTGPAVPLIENVALFTAAAPGAGSLVYRPVGVSRSLVWTNRKGEEQTLPAPKAPYVTVRISPDGNRLAIDYEGDPDLWIYDLSRTSLTRLTSHPSTDLMPVWSLDARRVAFFSRRESAGDLYWKASDGSGSVERLTTNPNRLYPFDWSQDGEYLVFEEPTPDGSDIGMLSMDDRSTFVKVVDGAFDETNPDLSSDGKWIAYESNESGRLEVYVESFPPTGARWPISDEGGRVPLWHPSGKELFYRNGDAVMVVPIETSPSFSPGNPEVLFRGDYSSDPGRAYDIAPDGERFLMIKADEDENTELEVVLDWFAELERLVPTRN